MALIKCPECGKEISDKSSACINCGFPLSELANMQVEEKPSKEVIYYNLLDAKMKTIFDNGLDEGATGRCIVNGFGDDYRVENGFVSIVRRAGTVKYKIDGDFLVNLNGRENGIIPEQDKFNATCTSKSFTGSVDTTSYKDDGSYSGTSLGRHDSGTYKRKGQMLVKCGSSTGNVPNGFLIYDENIYTASYIKEERLPELKDLFSQFGIQPSTPISTIPNPRLTTPLVKCPYCQSSNTKKISSAAKAVNVAMFGLLGNKRKYQWHCNNCNSDF